MIFMYIDVKHKTWYQILPYETITYNTTVRERTLFRPFCLLYGREVQTMLGAMLPCEDS